jgi:chromosome segregation protein
MYLKNLQLVGFKSFAEKTSLEFLPGVTAIVGPNGCGKSNVADAIRWVLGEQSAKALRGGEMADVIFNGTDNRRPISMAEVSLTVGDVNPEQLRAAGVPIEYNEVTVSRRVFRDGHGEYFINKTPVRLKDVQQLFMDTGVGRSSYSLMAQGQIDQILSAHPEDRRMIFEEAAGITKFKSQKKEALRKLEHTEANLVRLADIIREVKRQIGSLQRQAGKARRYRELHDQLKMLETRLARHQYDEYIEQIKARQAEADKFAAELAEAMRQTESGESQLSATRRGLEELELQTNQVVQRGMEIQGNQERHSQRISFNNERIAELAEQTKRAEADIAASEEKIVVQQQNLAQIEQELKQAEESVKREQARVTEFAAASKQTDEQIELQQQEADQLKNQSIELESTTAHLRNELSSLDTTQRNATVRLERLTAEKHTLAVQREQYEQKVETFRTEITRQREQIEAERAGLQEKRRKLEELGRQLQEAHSQLLEQSAQLEGSSQKLRLWQQLEAEHDGISEGGKALLQRANEFGVAGSLAQVLHVSPDFTVAMETALGHSLQAILVRDAESAQAIAGILRGQQIGRAALLLTNWSAEAKPRGAPPEWAIGCAADRVECAPEYRPAVERVLGQVLIVDTIQTALAHPSHDWDMVTRDGEWVGREGLVVSGASSTGPLVRRGQIAECQKIVEQLTAATQSLKQRLTEVEAQRVALDREVSDQTSAMHRAEMTLASKEGELHIIESESQDVVLKVETVDFELHSLSSQEGAQVGRRQEILTQIEANGKRQEELHAQLSQADQRVAELEDERRRVSDQLTDAKIALATGQQRCDSLLGQKQPAEMRVTELREQIASRRAEIESNAQRTALLQAEIAESQAQLEQLKAERAEVDRLLNERNARRQEINAQISQQEEQIRVLHKQSSEAQQRKNDVDIKLTELRMTVNQLKERIQQKYQVNLEDIRGEGFMITIADTGKPEIHEVTATEAAQAGATVTNWDEVQQQVVELQSRLDAMGPVNIGAVEEFEELEQRHKFLSEQQDDLLKAKEQLLEVLAKISTTTKQMFTETFEKIRANFQEMFGELFGGGKANLLLVDEGDVLESGIEIVARPPGKQLQSISLLSGGERTMTAVALLFSIYMVKPSPFCVLDELDAPLDESNINRFIKILQRFVNQSQFIIITHNKRTIAMGDALYGVTMEEHGISKIVSVKFRKHVEITAPTTEARLDVKALPGESPIVNEETDEVSAEEHVPATHIEEPPSPEEMEKLRQAQAPWKHEEGSAAQPVATAEAKAEAAPEPTPAADQKPPQA